MTSTVISVAFYYSNYSVLLFVVDLAFPGIPWQTIGYHAGLPYMADSNCVAATGTWNLVPMREMA